MVHYLGVVAAAQTFLASPRLHLALGAFVYHVAWPCTRDTPQSVMLAGLSALSLALALSTLHKMLTLLARPCALPYLASALAKYFIFYVPVLLRGDINDEQCECPSAQALQHISGTFSA